MAEKDISIIIPVYNVEKYIERFLLCLEQQTARSFVAIFVDDKSTDSSLELLEKFKKTSSFEMVILKNDHNMGQSISRNVGLDYVGMHKTKYLTFLDSDDWMENDYLEDLYCSAEKYELDICISGIDRINDYGQVICTEMVHMPEKVFDKPIDCDLLAYINPCLYAKLFRYEKIKHIRFVDMKRSEDTCFFCESLCFCDKIKFTNNPRYHYCVRNNSLTGQMNMAAFESMNKGFLIALPFFDNVSEHGIRDFFVSQVFIRSSVGGVLRVSGNKFSDIRKIEKQELHYLNGNIHGWKSCKYLRIYMGKSAGLKGIALAMCACLYRMHLYSFFVIFYRLYSKVRRKEIRM